MIIATKKQLMRALGALATQIATARRTIDRSSCVFSMNDCMDLARFC